MDRDASQHVAPRLPGASGAPSVRSSSPAPSAIRGEAVRERLIVHQAVASEVGEIFVELHRQQFPIQDISPALTKLGKDDALMRSNVTSAFNCRAITGGKRILRHSYGRAIDINPLWNPYIKGMKVQRRLKPRNLRGPPRDVSEARTEPAKRQRRKALPTLWVEMGEGTGNGSKTTNRFEKKRQ